MLHDLGYADDAGFIADTYEQLASWARALQAHYSTWGLSLSVAKTEALTTAAEGGRGPISMDAPEGAPSQIQFSFPIFGYPDQSGRKLRVGYFPSTRLGPQGLLATHRQRLGCGPAGSFH